MSESTAKRKSVRTCKVRLSYVNLFELHETESKKKDGSPKMQYDCAFILPKAESVTDPTYKAEVAKTKSDLLALCHAAAVAKWGVDIPKGLVNPIKDGDGTKVNTGEPYAEEYRGCWHFNAQSGEKYKPVVVLNERDPATGNWKRGEPSQVYSGCYGRVVVEAYAWEFRNKQGAIQKRGVSFNVLTVQKLEDGEMLGGASANPEDYFDGEGMAAAAGVGHAGQTAAESLFDN